MACESNPIMVSQGVEYDVESLDKAQTVSMISNLFPTDSTNRINLMSSESDHHSPTFMFQPDYKRRLELFKTRGVECVYVDNEMQSMEYFPKENPIGTKAYLVGKGEGPYPPDDGTPIYQINPIEGEPATAVVMGDDPKYFDIAAVPDDVLMYIPENYKDNMFTNTVYYPKNFRMKPKDFFNAPFMCWGNEFARSTMIVAMRILYDHGVRDIDMYRISFKDTDVEKNAMKKKREANKNDYNGEGWYEGTYGECLVAMFKKLSPVFIEHGLTIRNTTPNSKLGLWEDTKS